MTAHVHRPVICGTCKAEMDANVTEDWFRCRTCGLEREVGK